MTDFEDANLENLLPKAKRCPKCGVRMNSSGHIKGNKYVNTYVCPKCNYAEVE